MPYPKHTQSTRIEIYLPHLKPNCNPNVNLNLSCPECSKLDPTISYTASLTQFIGHFILVMGLSQNGHNFLYLDPSAPKKTRRNHVCRVPLRTLHTARLAPGTDQDLIAIHCPLSQDSKTKNTKNSLSTTRLATTKSSQNETINDLTSKSIRKSVSKGSTKGSHDDNVNGPLQSNGATCDSKTASRPEHHSNTRFGESTTRKRKKD